MPKVKPCPSVPEQQTITFTAADGRSITQETGGTIKAKLCKENHGVSGYLEDAQLVSIESDVVNVRSRDKRLVPEAAVSLQAMAAVYKSQTDDEFDVTSAYRDIKTQKQVFQRQDHRRYPLASSPGSSDRGWGIIIDVPGGNDNDLSYQQAWMVDNAGKFGWEMVAPPTSTGVYKQPQHWIYDDGNHATSIH